MPAIHAGTPSLRLTDVAATFTRTWPAAGKGIGTSATRNTSEAPYRSYTTAFTPTPCDPWSWQQPSRPERSEPAAGRRRVWPLEEHAMGTPRKLTPRMTAR